MIPLKTDFVTHFSHDVFLFLFSYQVVLKGQYLTNCLSEFIEVNGLGSFIYSFFYSCIHSFISFLHVTLLQSITCKVLDEKLTWGEI